MANLFAWLLSAAVPIVKRVLVTLGIGWATYESLSVLASSVVSAMQSNWSQTTGAVLQISSLGGIPEMLGIVTGALVARASLLAIGKLGKVVA